MLGSSGADWLHDFTSATFIHYGVSHHVHRRGAGPAVIVMSEISGVTPAVAKYATRVADAGFTVYVPELIGTPVAPTRRAAPALQHGERGAGVHQPGMACSPRTGPARSWTGCGLWPGMLTESAGDQVSAPSACASPATSAWR